MKFSPSFRNLLILCFNLLVMLPAIAATTVDLPAEKTQGSVSYISGGVGKEEASAMRSAQTGYPLSMEFVQHARPHNEFVAQVKVDIKKRHGESVLNIDSEGPFLLVKLPDGKYTVTVDFAGHTQTRHVAVSEKKHRHLTFVWK